ncbi:MAG: adenosylcobinamide-GDP ribazoletransferase [Kiritimatiellia bacterium]
MKRLVRSFVTAFKTLTVLPLGGGSAGAFADSLYWFPVTGFFIGAALYVPGRLIYAWGPLAWPEGPALLIVLISVLITGGLHLDGLSDWADGFWGGRNAQRSLAIMKDSAVGTFGAAALVFIILAKWICLTRLLDYGRLHWIIIACVLSRSVQVPAASFFPYARPEGGTGKAFIDGAGRRHAFAALLAGLILALAVSRGEWIPAACTAAGAVVFTLLFCAWSLRKIGGVTGDILGAVSEITETGVLFAAVFM